MRSMIANQTYLDHQILAARSMVNRLLAYAVPARGQLAKHDELRASFRCAADEVGHPLKILVRCADMLG